MTTSDDHTIAFIPAKGGSKRFPRKNIAELDGKPLLHWTLDAALQSKVADLIVVSSEDPAVLECARAGGADLALERPQKLARDPAGIVDVALFGLDQLETRGDKFNTLLILPPTAPFRNVDDIREAMRIHAQVRPHFVMSVSPFTHTPFAALLDDEDGTVTPAFPDYFGRKSQELPQAYRPNGAIHVLDIERFRSVRSYLEPPLIPYVMPRERSFDIDTPADLEEASVWLQRSGLKEI